MARRKPNARMSFITLEWLLPIWYKIIRIGVCHAQRDLLTQTLIVAAQRAGQQNLVRALLTERLAVRPPARARAELSGVSGATALHS